MMMYTVPLVLGALKFTSMPGGGGTGSWYVSRKGTDDIVSAQGGFCGEERQLNDKRSLYIWIQLWLYRTEKRYIIVERRKADKSGKTEKEAEEKLEETLKVFCKV